MVYWSIRDTWVYEYNFSATLHEVMVSIARGPLLIYITRLSGSLIDFMQMFRFDHRSLHLV